MKFIEILNNLAKHDNYKLLSSIGFLSSFHENEKDNSRLSKAYEFIYNNFNKSISLAQDVKRIDMIIENERPNYEVFTTTDKNSVVKLSRILK